MPQPIHWFYNDERIWSNAACDYLHQILDLQGVVVIPPPYCDSEWNRLDYLLSLLLDNWGGGGGGTTGWWSLKGNTGTSEVLNWFGTNDNKSVHYRTNNIDRGKLLDTGGLHFYSGADTAKGYFLVDPTNWIFGMGDYTEQQNETQLYIDDAAQFFQLSVHDDGLNANFGIFGVNSPGNQQVLFGDITVSTMWQGMDFGALFIGWYGGQNLTKLEMSDVNETLRFVSQFPEEELFFLDNANDIIRFFDQYYFPPLVGATGEYLTVVDNATGELGWGALTSSQWITSGSNIYYAAGSVAVGGQAVDANNDFEVNDGAGNMYAYINITDQTAFFGDATAAAVLILDWDNETAVLKAGNQQIDFNITTADTITLKAGSTNMRTVWNNTTQEITSTNWDLFHLNGTNYLDIYFDEANDQFYLADPTAGYYFLGASSSFNETAMIGVFLNDKTGHVTIGNTTSNKYVKVDYTNDAITSLATHINTPLADYANDAAAVVGGLVTGDLYQTSGAVKIVQ